MEGQTFQNLYRESGRRKTRNNMDKNNTKLIVILGPTSSGKTALSIKLAKKFKGEIVSADSRQVYKGMDIGTGKITKKEMADVPHYLLDVVLPKTRFTISNYQKLANKAIKEIFKKNKLPILVGGTGFYIQSITDGIVIPEVKPDWNLRKKLEKETSENLFKRLQKLDSKRAKAIDKFNKRRLIRALEIIIKTGKPVPSLVSGSPTSASFEVLEIGITKKPEDLKKLIEKRLAKRLKQGMLNEAKKLHKSGVSWKRLEEFGLEYRYMAYYLQNKIDYETMVEKIQKESEHYAKRQMTWFKKDKRIIWVKNYQQAQKNIANFLNK
jgi:tRNA dimethylallyltransferase